MYLSISLRVHFFLVQPSITYMLFACFVLVSASSMMCFSSSPTHGLDALKVQARLQESCVLCLKQKTRGWCLYRSLLVMIALHRLSMLHDLLCLLLDVFGIIGHCCHLGLALPEPLFRLPPLRLWLLLPKLACVSST